MNLKNLFHFLLLFLFSIQFSQSQSTESTYLVRSTVGASGSSESIVVDNKSYVVQQSIGQASVTGTFNNARYTLRQGFIQPNVLAKIIDPNMSIDLVATFYPNPFIENVTLAFTEKIEGNISVVIFDLLGRLVFSKNYPANQNLNMRFNNLSVAGHILKVTANNKQFIKTIIKSRL
jgi:hypothetical protein